MTSAEFIDRLWDVERRRHETELHRLRSEDAARPKPEPPAETLRYRPELLRPAQCRVAGLVADGLLDIEIADRLGVTSHTVQQHISALSMRLGMIPNRVRLALMVRDWREGRR